MLHASNALINDFGGGFIVNIGSTLQLGMYNPAASTWGVIPSGASRSLLGLSHTGRVGTLTKQVTTVINAMYASDEIGLAEWLGAVRRYHAGKLVKPVREIEALPELDSRDKTRVSATLAAMGADEAGRRQIAVQQRQSVVDRLTYYQTLKRSMRRVPQSTVHSRRLGWT